MWDGYQGYRESGDRDILRIDTHQEVVMEMCHYYVTILLLQLYHWERISSLSNSTKLTLFSER